MKIENGIIIGLITIAVLMSKNIVPIPETKPELISLYEKHSTKNVPAKLLRAVAIVESGENITAFNPADPSYGLMQVLYTGSNKLYVDGWPPSSASDLYSADYNLRIASQILDYNIRKYGFFRGVISYNNWSARDGAIPMQSINYFLKVFSTFIRL
jgi:soluble lytic murein transglycosylase-like protein